ncbi:MAG: sulfurtransferase [Ignavibacteria bacterium GWF2_33_9]|nr:MAG: sulfurtransferase [Ignavibacteria bacterium GWF2_33_9]
MNNLSPLISPQELLSLQNDTHLFIFDASNSAASKARYSQEHLQGAFWIDLDTEIATIDPDLSKGGRHPLPSLENFSATLTKFGLKPEHKVIIYDEESAGNAAARLWWMLRAVGHEYVRVVDGGYQAAKSAGYSLSNDKPIHHNSQKYICNSWNLPLVNMQDMDEIIKDDSYRIVDVRVDFRYKGIMEPIDLIAGHIPGAVNSPYPDNLDKSGFYLPKDEMKAKYENIMKGYSPDKVVFYCGSGVSACHSILAIAHAGLSIPKIYMGSWSEWSRNNRPMILKK